MRRVLGELAEVIEGGGTFSEGLAQNSKVFNKLFVSMVKAGELGGVLEVVLDRLAMFMEKAMRIKGKVKAAMFYPVAVLVVAIVIMGVLMVFVIPKFKDVFEGDWWRGGFLGSQKSSLQSVTRLKIAPWAPCQACLPLCSPSP